VIWPNWVFKLIMTKSNFKKSVLTWFQWRHRYYVTEKRYQTNVTRFSTLSLFPSYQNFRLRQCCSSILTVVL